MATLHSLLGHCPDITQTQLLQKAKAQTALWDKWLQPISSTLPVGEDPGYDDDFQRMREEVNKISGADTELICQLAEKLLTTVCKDVRVATYYLWARLHRDGESGLAEGLELLSGLIARYGDQLLPSRKNSRLVAMEWLSGSKVLDSLSLYPEVDKPEFERILASLALFEDTIPAWEPETRPQLSGLYDALGARLAQSGGFDAVVPQNSGGQGSAESRSTSQEMPALRTIQSGRELLDQAKALAQYLRDQPQGWLSGHRLMTTVRWDTVDQLPPLDAKGCTRLVPPRAEYRAHLKRLFLQQSWSEILENADRMFSEGVNHFWLDLQWYLYQALSKSGAPYDGWAEFIKQDLRLLLIRLPGLETLAYSDGTPFADEVTAGWISGEIQGNSVLWQSEQNAASVNGDDDVLQLEAEALAQADSDGIESALNWLQTRPGMNTYRQRWLIRLLMARITEQYGKNEMALHLLSELETTGNGLTLAQWEPAFMFEVKARRLKLLRMKVQRGDTNKTLISQEMDTLLAGLFAIDPARAAVLCA